MDASLSLTPLSKRWWALVAGASVALASIGATPAWAEDAPSETPPSEPAAEAEYVPPAEAHEGVGGWAVVDPETGNVHGVIVGTIETFNARGGAIGHEYMGCHSNCVLRFQTRATADGNVAGWHGTQTHVDAQGQATQSNDGSVKWNPSTNTFSLNNQVAGGQSSMTLVPERTARDAAGMDLGTGIVDIQTNITREAQSQTARVRVFQSDLQDTSSDVSLVFPLWSPEGKTFSYVLGQSWLGANQDSQAALDQITLDVDGALAADGYTTDESSLDPDTGEEVTETVVDDNNAFVQAIRSVTQSVVEFLGTMFGLNREMAPASE
jgi:hypothetical protein